MTNYEELRRSFDNILKELDDICKSIDDLTDFEQNYYLRSSSVRPQPPQSLNISKPIANKPTEPVISNASRSPRTNRIYERYKKQFSLDQQVNGNGNSNGNVNGSSRRPNILTSPPSPQKPKEEAETQEKDVTPRSSSKQRSSSKKKQHHKLTESKKSSIPLLNSVIGSAANFFLSSTSDVSGSSSSKQSNQPEYATVKKPEASPLKSEWTEEQERDYNQHNTNHNHTHHHHHHHNHHNGHHNGHQNGHLNNDQQTHEYLLPLDLVNNDNYQQQNSEEIIEETVRPADDYINILVNNESVAGEGNNDEIEVNGNGNGNGEVTEGQDDDYLKGSELAKIECFYSSMGCYVYVGRCLAELYQIKREDEFDHIDSDPVDDYREFMKNKRRQWRRDNQNENESGRRKQQFAANKFNRLFMSLNEPNNNGNESSSDTEDHSSSTNVKSAPVNYMYINSGVPVIVFNYGANPKRNKDLRIVLAERSTGFCLWEFKFDRLTQFDNSEEMTVIRLSLNQPQQPQQQQSNLLQPGSSHSTSHSIFSSMFSHHPFSSSNASSSNGANQMAYHNEYFERFFNAAKSQRQNQKEYLIKFVIKRDCDEFCYKLSRIINDKRNSDLFINDNSDGLKPPLKSFYQSNQSLNSINSSVSANQAHLFTANSQQNQPKSSVIICHFDFFNYELNYDANSLAASFTRKEKPSALANNSSHVYHGHYENGSAKNDNYQRLGDNMLPNMPKSAIKSSTRLVRQHSSSSANILPTTPSRRSGLMRFDSLRSNEADLETTSLSATNTMKKPYGEMKQLSGSVINLGTTNKLVEPASTTTNSSSASKAANRIKTLLVKYKKLKKSDISSPLNFNHVTHLDKPVPIGKRYKIDYC